MDPRIDPREELRTVEVGQQHVVDSGYRYENGCYAALPTL